MPNIDLSEPYEVYVKNLVNSGLYSTYAEVIKDALRLHMNSDTEAKRISMINAAIAEGEADIAAGRVTEYTPELMDQLTQSVMNEEDV